MMSAFCLARSQSLSLSLRIVERYCKHDWTILGRLCTSWTGTNTRHHRCASNLRNCRYISHSPSRLSNGTVDTDEIAKFDRAAEGWWERVYGSENVALHTLNQLRVPLIRDALVQQTVSDKLLDVDAAQPLKGLRILDVGCGGGILSEPLARLGAEVTGVDASKELIRVAVAHADLDPETFQRLTYICSSIDHLNRSELGHFDGVIASEIVEHVTNADSFISSCCSFVKPGGSIFITTVSKTMCSYLTAIFAAEKLFGIVPAGTHEWNKFIDPDDMEHVLIKNNFSVRQLLGMTLNPLTLKWCWINNTAVNYAMHAVRMADDNAKRSVKHDAHNNTENRDKTETN